jgi:2-aminoadipate transaminase
MRKTYTSWMPEPPQRRRAHTLTRDLERYADLFAGRTSVMRSSAMRDLMAITARPEVISLAGGLPDTSTFPPATFAADMTRIAQTSAAEALQYGPTEGFDETVDCIIQVMGAEGMLPDHDDVIVTTGGQQAIDLVSKVLLDPGDVVICEAPSYPGAIPVFCSYEADVIQVECDDDGMRIEELEAVLERLDGEGRRPKFIYSVPSFQNPAGVTMSMQRRQRLVELARIREMLVVEDNPYGLLRFGGEPLPPLYQLDGGDYVVYIGTLSKILSPGIRLGWAVAPPPVMEKIVLGKQAADLCTSTLTQYFVREYFAEGRWREYIESLVEIYRGRRDTMLAALREHFPPEATWTHPEGGLFIWATLPEFIDTGDLLARALREDVAFVPGQAAYVDERGRNSMRLNFSGSDEGEIEEGVRRIGKVIREQVELYSTLTHSATSSAPAQPRESDMDAAGLPRPGVAGGEPEPGGDVLPFRKEESA